MSRRVNSGSFQIEASSLVAGTGAKVVGGVAEFSCLGAATSANDASSAANPASAENRPYVAQMGSPRRVVKESETIGCGSLPRNLAPTKPPLTPTAVELSELRPIWSAEF